MTRRETGMFVFLLAVLIGWNLTLVFLSGQRAARHRAEDRLEQCKDLLVRIAKEPSAAATKRPQIVAEDYTGCGIIFFDRNCDGTLDANDELQRALGIWNRPPAPSREIGPSIRSPDLPLGIRQQRVDLGPISHHQRRLYIDGEADGTADSEPER